MDWVIVDLHDQPVDTGEVTGAAQLWPIASDEDSVDDEFDVRPAECQHDAPPWSQASA
jgi:hypothetical protein